MSHLRALGVNDAFKNLLGLIVGGELKMSKSTSRVGDVLVADYPVMVTYLDPRQRVLFNEARDCNPFFHLMEALWMLQGRNDLAPLQYYISTFGNYSDDGKTLNGAYGYRWRNGWYYGREWRDKIPGTSCDQLKFIVEHLHNKPDSRRAVLQMWNVEDDLLKANKSSDVCCNVCAFFSIREGRLELTVVNRSNDLVWGMLGANVVHFSILHEYMAAKIGVELGPYNQFTNNLHVYVDRWDPEAWINDTTPNYYLSPPRLNSVELVQDPEQFDIELKDFNENWLGKDLSNKLFLNEYREPFFRSVAFPMAVAFYRHKKRDYKHALETASHILSDDWRIACTTWLRKRQASYERAKDDGPNPYLKNELDRQGVNDGNLGIADRG